MSVLSLSPTRLLKRTCTFKLNTLSCRQFLIVELDSSENWAVAQITYSTWLLFFPFGSESMLTGWLNISFMPFKKYGLFAFVAIFFILAQMWKLTSQ